MSVLRIVAIVCCLLGPALAAPDPMRDKAADALVAAAFEDADGTTTLPAGGRELFAAVLARSLFVRGQVGPFDVAVLQADGLKKAADARKILSRALEGLAPLARLIEREFPAGAGQVGGSVGGMHGLITGRRFTVVLTSARVAKKEGAFEQVVALLDRCEDAGFSGYKPDLPVWNAQKRAADSVVTWEVGVFNIAHPSIAEQDAAWIEHGLGYSMALLLSSRMLFRGASGPVPPWLLQGLTDELDLEAYGTAWVAAGESSSWMTFTKGWSNAGWEGFVPEGSHPPPPITGPPPGQRSERFETKVASSAWLERDKSRTRCWSELVADLKSEAPVSLASMAAAQTFSPRDRAWSRCVLHLLLDIGRPDTPEADGSRPASKAGLLRALDRESQRARSGLLDGEPLPRILARVLGTTTIDAQVSQSVEDFVSEIARPDLAARLVELKAAPLLKLKEHAAQADWLYTQTQFDSRTRLSIFTLIAEIENYRELRQWELLGLRLDAATRAALGTSKSYPQDAKARAAAATAFRAALVGS